jgi:hypothetical protein
MSAAAIASTLLCTCGLQAVYHATSEHIYNGRDYGPAWCCPGACDAYVGCHPDGSPKGTLANKATRDARGRAHASFDPLWQDVQAVYRDIERPSGHIRQLMRVRAYQWASAQLRIAFDSIATLDEAQCDRVVQLIREHMPTAATVRTWAKARAAAEIQKLRRTL